ncbi:unnamed protein product [Caenorhabditis bovis]|uniref:Uncharacterized protein n=1 Tax=Caenorhabditis bovis TaxID=2654633 RepID=A0A8S1EAU1_9PELO|nr:unnamed protein product [Caenorhabditis bovis]
MSFEEPWPEKPCNPGKNFGKHYQSRKKKIYKQIKDHQLLQKTIKYQEYMDQPTPEPVVQYNVYKLPKSKNGKAVMLMINKTSARRHGQKNLGLWEVDEKYDEEVEFSEDEEPEDTPYLEGDEASKDASSFDEMLLEHAKRISLREMNKEHSGCLAIPEKNYGKHYQSRRKKIYNQVKDHQLLEKTIKNQENMDQKIVEDAAKKCNDDLELNVMYSMNKKGRWEGAKDCGELLKCAPIDQPAEVVEKNFLRQYGSMNYSNSTFAVHKKENEDEDGFEIRTASTSSGRGQHYSNFSEKNRELSKKGGHQQKEEELATEPVVQYNVYKVPKSKNGKALILLNYITPSRNRKKYLNFRGVDEEVEFSEDEEPEDTPYLEGDEASEDASSFDEMLLEHAKRISLREMNKEHSGCN